jgi:esterase/lipase superfamily enzyme
VVRWGTFGTPVLLFPTAGGDAEECERFLMIKALMPLLEAGRIKVYGVDSVAGKVLTEGKASPQYFSWIQSQFQSFVYHEVIPAIRKDCNDDRIETIAAGASIGAFNALGVLCRYPDVFSKAICMSGTFDIVRFLPGGYTQDFYFSSPIHFLPNLDAGAQIDAMRKRFVLFAFGQGRWEDPQESWRMAGVLGSKGVPNRVDPWGQEWDHNWVTWREMLPKYLNDLA